MYASKSFQTKKALREAVEAGRKISVFQPFMGDAPMNGTVSLEGPNYEMHRWYARATLVDGYIVKVK